MDEKSVKALKLAKQIKAIKGKYYIDLDVDVSMTNIDKAKKTQIKTPKLHKLGKVKMGFKCENHIYFNPTVDEVLDVIPNEFTKTAVAFKIRPIAKDILTVMRNDWTIPAVVTFYSLKDGQNVPKEVEQHSVKRLQQTYLSEEIEKF